MIRVRNKKIIARLAKMNLQEKKRRNTIAVLAIILTSILFTTLFTLGLGIIENMQQGMMRESGSSAHGSLKYITDDVYEKIKIHPLIKQIGYSRILADEVTNKTLAKRQTELWYLDDVALKQSFCEPTHGHKPVKKQEVIVDTYTLDYLGVPQEEGVNFSLDLLVHGKSVSRKFILAGWYESDPLAMSGMIITSKAYVEAHEDELINTYHKDLNITGSINADITFKNSLGLREKLDRVIIESGYSILEQDEKYIQSNVNWAYISTNGKGDPTTIVLMVSFLGMVTLTGYLIIYNIFQLSVVRDIQFYGLLKTIGTTKSQIKQMIRKEAGRLAVLGIPLGLVLGFILGKILVPRFIEQSAYASLEVKVSCNPWIFIGSIIFTSLTIWISTNKPGKIAANVSPVEAVKYISDNKDVVGSVKPSKKGNKLLNMARANLSRNKKQTFVVMLSLSLSLVLANSICTLSQSIDTEKYVSKHLDADYVVAHNDLFQNKFTGSDNQTSNELIKKIERLDTFKEGGRVYNDLGNQFTVKDSNNTTQDWNVNEQGDFLTQVMGLDDFPLNNLKIIEGEIDLEALKNGKAILEGIFLDDNSKPIMEEAHYQIGDQVTLHYYKDVMGKKEYKSRTFTVAGYVEIHDRSNFSGISLGDYNFYVPFNIYAEMVEEPVVMDYMFNIKQGGEKATDTFLDIYTNQDDFTMDYTSKTKYLQEIDDLRMTMILVGGAITLIITIIGVLNYINSTITGILARQKEFAMLESIGMTGSQLKRMLIEEGIYYVLGTGVLSIGLSVISSITLIRTICNLIAFLNYHFIIWPMAAIMPIFAGISLVVPRISYRFLCKKSIVECLREY